MEPKVKEYCFCSPATHAFCKECRTVRHFVLVKVRTNRKVLSFTRFEGGRLECQACGNTIASLYRETPKEDAPSLLAEALGTLEE